MTSEEIRQEAEVHCNEVMCTVCENKTCTERIKCREWRDRCAGYYCGAEPRENKIADIKANCDLAIEGRDIKIKELEQQIEKMKCCGNCEHFNFNEPNYCHKGVYRERQYVCSEWEFGN